MRLRPIFLGSLAILLMAAIATTTFAATKVVVAQKSAHPLHLRRYAHHSYTYFVYLHRGHRIATFDLARNVLVHLGPNANARLGDLKLGEQAHVSYTVENGHWLAHEIAVRPHGSHLRGSIKGEHHAHGAILGYNTAAGNITIRYHR